MKKIIFLMFTLLIMTTLVHAQVLNVVLNIDASGDVNVDSIDLYPGDIKPSSESSQTGNYRFVIEDKSGIVVYETYFTPSFSGVVDIEYTDGSHGSEIEEYEESFEFIEVEMKGNMDAFKVFKGDKIILEESLDVLCNHNTVCEGYESYISCPKDCASGSSDNYCDKAQDGVCDPDCAPSRDIDCSSPSTGDANTIVFILAIVLLLVVIFVVFKFYRKK